MILFCPNRKTKKTELTFHSFGSGLFPSCHVGRSSSCHPPVVRSSSSPFGRRKVKGNRSQHMSKSNMTTMTANQNTVTTWIVDREFVITKLIFRRFFEQWTFVEKPRKKKKKVTSRRDKRRKDPCTGGLGARLGPTLQVPWCQSGRGAGGRTRLFSRPSFPPRLRSLETVSSHFHVFQLLLTQVSSHFILQLVSTRVVRNALQTLRPLWKRTIVKI